MYYGENRVIYGGLQPSTDNLLILKKHLMTGLLERGLMPIILIRKAKSLYYFSRKNYGLRSLKFVIVKGYVDVTCGKLLVLYNITNKLNHKNNTPTIV